MHPFRIIGGAAAAGVVLLAVATRTAAVQRLDDAIERFAGRHRARLLRTASIGTLPGENYVHPSIGAFYVALVLALRPGGSISRAFVPLAAASLGAILAHHAVKLVYRRPRPAIALGKNKREPAYPSGHTTDATAVLLTGAYLVWREGILPLEVILSLALPLAIVTGVSRVALGWHWATDVLGGWMAGLAVAAGCAGVYEVLR